MIQRIGLWLTVGGSIGIVIYLALVLLVLVHNIVPLGGLLALMLAGAIVAALYDLLGPRVEPPRTDDEV